MNSCVKQVLVIFFVSFVLLQGYEGTPQPTEEATSANGTTPTSIPTTEKNELNVSTSTTANPNITSPTHGKSEKNNGSSPSTDNDVSHSFPPKDNSGLLQRSLYVAVGVSAIVAIYFIVRAVKTRGRRKAKKYGVIHGNGETEPLERGVEEEEDDDMTVFDRKTVKWPK